MKARTVRGRGTVAFVCDRCNRPIYGALDHPADGLSCPRCGAMHALRGDALSQGNLARCVRCGEERLYTQKDFNRKLGLAVFAVAALLSVPTWGLSLLVATIIDVMLYYLIGDVTICYGCSTQHRGFGKNPEHGPFDLHVAEAVDRRPRTA